MVFNPTDTTHTLICVPRFHPSTALTLNLKNEALVDDKDGADVSNTYNVLNGKLRVDFTYTFTDRERFQVKITDALGEVVFRGKIFATTQTPQDFKLNATTYYYE